MPLAAPVMTATLPLKSFMTRLLPSRDSEAASIHLQAVEVECVTLPHVASAVPISRRVHAASPRPAALPTVARPAGSSSRLV